MKKESNLRKSTLAIMLVVALFIFLSASVLAISTVTPVYFNIADTAPTVTLISPPQDYTSTSTNITFTCNATDIHGLSNISLYLTNSTNQSFALNQTTSINGTSNLASWMLELDNGNYTWNCLAYDTGGLYDWGDQNRSLTVNFTNITSIGKPNLTITLNPDNSSSDLNWTDVPNADTYTVYYGTNLCEMKVLNVSNVTSGISTVTGITSSNWTDYNASDNQTRYYRVSAVRGSLENLSDDIVGKHTYELLATSAGTNDNKRKTWISLPFYPNIDAETFIQNVPNDYGIRVRMLDRPNNDSYSYITHNKAGPNNFTMYVGSGYEVEVSNDVNYTVVGDAVTSAITYEFFGIPTGTNDNKRKTWVGTRQCTLNNSDAETFIQNVPSDYGIRVKMLSRVFSNSYDYIVHNKAGPNNFTMDLGGGYEIEVSNSVNYTFT